MAVQFTHPDVDKSYECLAASDIIIGVPGHYSGPLSRITPKAAAYMITVKDPHIRQRRVAKKPSKPAAESSATDQAVHHE